LFNLFGWIWESTQKLNLLTLSLTAFSWFILGIWYGFGYCPSTHWHWLVRRDLGYTDMPNSYIKFLIDELTGIAIPAQIVDTATVILFIGAFICSLMANFRTDQK
jgi:hypothetical protein